MSSRESAELTGVIVDQKSETSSERLQGSEVDISRDGLYLLTDGGQLFKLVNPIGQARPETMWKQSRSLFTPYLNQKVTAQGYISEGIFWVYPDFIKTLPA